MVVACFLYAHVLPAFPFLSDKFQIRFTPLNGSTIATCREDIARLHKMRGGASLVVDNNRLVHTNVQLKNRHALNADDSCHASVPFLIDASMVRRRRCNDVDVEYRYDDRFYYFRYIIGPEPTIPNTRVTVYQCLQSLKKSRPIGSIAFAGEDGDNVRVF